MRYAETREYVRRVLWTYLVGTPPRFAPGDHQAAQPSGPRSPPAKRGGDQAVLDRLAKIKRGRAFSSAMAAGSTDRGPIQ